MPFGEWNTSWPKDQTSWWKRLHESVGTVAWSFLASAWGMTFEWQHVWVVPKALAWPSQRKHTRLLPQFCLLDLSKKALHMQNLWNCAGKGLWTGWIVLNCAKIIAVCLYTLCYFFIPFCLSVLFPNWRFLFWDPVLSFLLFTDIHLPT